MPGDDVKECRLAAAGLADDGHELAGIDLKAHAFECSKGGGRTLVALHCLPDIDQMCRLSGAVVPLRRGHMRHHHNPLTTFCELNKPMPSSGISAIAIA